jgi:hypothetical protein
MYFSQHRTNSIKVFIYVIAFSNSFSRSFLDTTSPSISFQWQMLSNGLYRTLCNLYIDADMVSIHFFVPLSQEISIFSFRRVNHQITRRLAIPTFSSPHSVFNLGYKVIGDAKKCCLAIFQPHFSFQIQLVFTYITQRIFFFWGRRRKTTESWRNTRCLFKRLTRARSPKTLGFVSIRPNGAVE